MKLHYQLLFWFYLTNAASTLQTERHSTSQARFSFTEERPHYSVVGNLATQLRQNDATCAARYAHFRLVRPSRFFGVHENGTIFATQRIDRESLADSSRLDDNAELRCTTAGRLLSTTSCSVHLLVWARDQCKNAAVQVSTTIEIVDVNDNVPRWPSDSLHLRFQSGRIFERWQLPTATDADQGDNARITYSLEGADEESLRYFQLMTSNSTPFLAIRKPLSQKSTYLLRVLASDNGLPKLTSTLSVRVTFNEMSDSPPKFDRKEYVVHVSEDEPVNFIVCNLEAHDNDTDQTLTFSIGTTTRLREGISLPFEVEPSGMVRLTKAIDHELRKEYTVDVEVSDGMYTDMALLKVIVDDVNDNSPIIRLVRLGHDGSGSLNDYSISVRENAAQKEIGLLEIYDADSGANGQVECRIGDSAATGSRSGVHFQLQAMPGFVDESSTPIFAQLITNGNFDRESYEEHSVVVECIDKAKKQPRRSFAVLTIRVEDDNDNPPVFNQSSYTVHVKEHNQADKVITQFKAYDKDKPGSPNANITYSIRSTSVDVGKYLQIDPNSGILRAKQSFDRETMERLLFTVIAEDNGSVRLSSSAEVVLIIDDIDDNLPVFERSWYHFFINENEKPLLPIGQVRVSDGDRDSIFTHVYFKLQDAERSTNSNYSLASFFRIDENGHLFVHRELDAEVSRKIALTVFASNTDDFRHNASASITVHVNDANDNAPEFLFPNRTINSVHIAPVQAGQDVAAVKAIDVDFGRNAEVVYSLINFNSTFHVDETTGQIRTLEDLPTGSNSLFKLLVRASDRGNPQHSKVSVLNVYVLHKLETAEAKTAVTEAERDVASTSWIATHQTIVFVACVLSIVSTVTIGVSVTVFWTRVHKRRTEATQAESAPENKFQNRLNDTECCHAQCHIVPNALSAWTIDSQKADVISHCKSGASIEVFCKDNITTDSIAMRNLASPDDNSVFTSRTVRLPNDSHSLESMPYDRHYVAFLTGANCGAEHAVSSSAIFRSKMSTITADSDSIDMNVPTSPQNNFNNDCKKNFSVNAVL